MTQHYPLSTVEASVWCQKCYKDTPHRVLGGKLGYCLPCYKRSQDESAAAKKAAAAKPTQGSLW